MNRSVKIEIKGNIYEIKYPNTGEQIDMELMKVKIANGAYDDLRFSQNPLMQQQANIIDMISTFTVLIPKLREDLNVKTFFNLEEEQTKELLDIYNNEFIPFYAEIKNAIANPKKQLNNKKEFDFSTKEK